MNYQEQLESYQRAVSKQRDIFITARTQQEQIFNQWYNNLLTMPVDGILSKLSYDYRDLKFRELVSEWYTDEPNQEKADEQVAKVNAMMNEANKLYLELNKNAIELIKKYNELNG